MNSSARSSHWKIACARRATRTPGILRGPARNRICARRWKENSSSLSRTGLRGWRSSGRPSRNGHVPAALRSILFETNLAGSDQRPLPIFMLVASAPNPSLCDLINEKVQEDARGGVRLIDPKIAGHLRFLCHLQRERVEEPFQ